LGVRVSRDFLASRLQIVQTAANPSPPPIARVGGRRPALVIRDKNHQVDGNDLTPPRETSPVFLGLLAKHLTSQILEALRVAPSDLDG